MASRKPLVVSSAGEIQQLQAGDTLAVTTISGVDIISQTNDEAGAIVIGAPVYNDANDGVKKAKADASATSMCMGLVYDTSITNGVAGNIAVNGILAATTVQWDAVMGTSGGLTKGTVYYLSAATSGLGTATAPSTTGQYVTRLGIGISTTEMLIQIRDRILL